MEKNTFEKMLETYKESQYYEGVKNSFMIDDDSIPDGYSKVDEDILKNFKLPRDHTCVIDKPGFVLFMDPKPEQRGLKAMRLFVCGVEVQKVILFTLGAIKSVSLSAGILSFKIRIDDMFANTPEAPDSFVPVPKKFRKKVENHVTAFAAGRLLSVVAWSNYNSSRPRNKVQSADGYPGGEPSEYH